MARDFSLDLGSPAAMIIRTGPQRNQHCWCNFFGRSRDLRPVAVTGEDVDF